MKIRAMIIVILCWILFMEIGMAQPPDNRYVAPLFTGFTETTNVLFSTNVPRPNPGGGFYETITGYPLNVDEFATTNVNLYMNVFSPEGDTLSNRPCVIICFGGGFIAGSKDHWSIRLLAQELAKRGFVTAVIDYRLGMNIFDQDLSMRAVYRGIQDGRSAVRFFKSDAAGADIFKVDPEQIYIGGHSAGAFVATHNAYVDKDIERPASTYTWPQGCGFFDLETCICPDQGCLDCVGDHQSFSGHAKAAFSLAGALGNLAYMESENDPKIVMFHSTDDDTVPFNSGQPFGSVSGWIAGFDLPVVYGSNQMDIRASNLNLVHGFHTYTDRGHSVHEETSSTLYADIVPGISEWFNSTLLKPVQHPISGRQYVCSGDLAQTYTTMNGQAAYYQWEVTGGTFISMSTVSPTVTVEWSSVATTRNLKLVPYSIWDSKGDQTILNVEVDSNFDNLWTSAGGGEWTDASNWSLGQVPDPCHDVMFTPSATTREIIAPATLNTAIRSILLDEHTQLTIMPGGVIIVE